MKTKAKPQKSKQQRLQTLVPALVAVLAVTLSGANSQAKAKKSAEPAVEEALRFREGDESGNELKALKTELLVSKSEARALAQLKKLEKKYAGTRMEPDILFRLAEIYMRRARTERFFEIHKNSQQVATFAPQLVKDASEAGEIRLAIAMYEKIQTKFTWFRSMDIVIFNNAYARQQLGEDKEAERLFGKLIQNHSSSPLVPDSYLAIGEINFVRRNYSFALENFRAIRKYPKARAYPYGLYKAAWCYYNMQDADSGIRQLEEVVKFGHAMAKVKADAKLDLRKEALSDMALFYGDVRAAKDAVEYFRVQAADLDAAPYVMRLSELYKRHSRFADIEIILKDVLAKLPENESTPAVHDELVWNYERMKNRSGAVQQLTAFDSWCDGYVSKQPKPKKGEKPVYECRDKITDSSKKLASKWHATWKKGGAGQAGALVSDDVAASAEQGYGIFLKNAQNKDTDLPAVRFSYAELLFARGKFRAASESYAMIEDYQAGGAKLEGALAHDAAYGALVALEKANGNKWTDEDEKLFVKLSESYVARFPQGQHVFDLRFKRAFIAYEKERYDEAATQFKKIGWTDIPAGQAVPEKVIKAQDLYLDILNIKKDYSTLKEAAQSLLARAPKSTDAGRVTQIEKIYREAYFAEIQLLEEKGNLAGAVEAYKKFALENAASELAPKAWWNASQLQFRMGDAQGGANTCYQMHKLFPKSSNGRDCLAKAAQTFEAMARLDLAARVLLNLALVETDKQDKWREVAADFFALSGSKDRAITMYVKLAEDRKPSSQVPLLEKAAILARETGDMKALEQIEDKYSRMGIEPQASRLVVEQAEEAFAKGDLTKAFNLSKKIVARESLPKNLQARARLLQARVLEDEYRKQSVKAKVDRIGLVLAIKTEKLEKAQKAYQSTIKYGDPETSVTALRRLADCYLDYAKSVKGISLGASVSAADVAAFSAEIEQIAVPMEEKGIEAMNQAFEAARKAQIRDGQIAELQAEVNRLNMKTNSQPAVTVASPVVYLPTFRAPAGREVGL